MHPLSFIEFLSALGKNLLIQEILSNPVEQKQTELVHDSLLNILGEYIAIGGMPQAVESWRTTKNLLDCTQILQFLVDVYKYDFAKYGKSHQIKYLELLFSSIPHQLGNKFKYSLVGEFRKRELEPCVQLLTTAGIIHEVLHSDAHGIPLGAQAHLDTFKLLFIDLAVHQYLLDLKPGDWILNPLQEFINKGAIAESFVGQEWLAYENPTKKAKLYYWKRDARGSEAEIDYLFQQDRYIIPVEVKSGKGSSMKSMQLFLESHPNSPYGIRFSTHNYSLHEKVHSYPLYAIAKLAANTDLDVKNALTKMGTE